MTDPATKTARIGIILTREEKQLIEDAAWRLRISVAEFIRRASIKRAKRGIQENSKQESTGSAPN